MAELETLGQLVAGNRSFRADLHINKIVIYIDSGDRSHALGLRSTKNYVKFLEIFIHWTTTIYRSINEVEAARLIIKVQNEFTKYQLAKEAVNEVS